MKSKVIRLNVYKVRGQSAQCVYYIFTTQTLCLIAEGFFDFLKSVILLLTLM